MMTRILNAATLTDHGHVAGRKLVLDILETGLQAADPYNNMRSALRLEGNLLHIGREEFEPSGSPRRGVEVIDLTQTGCIYVFGAGKGIQRVAKAIEDVLGERLTGGCVIDKHGTALTLERIEVVFGAHPIPDQGCVAGCQRIIELASDLKQNDLAFTLIGNGASALLTLPASGVSLEDIRQVSYLMQIERGAPTIDLIPVRNHLDQMKGGQFSRHLSPARQIHIIAFHRASYQDLMREAIYRWLHSLPDDTTYADAIRCLKKWDAWDEAPEGVRRHLLAADHARETLKVEEFAKMWSRIFCILPEELGMAPTARRRAQELGFRTYVLYDGYVMKAEASQVGKVVGSIALHSEKHGDPFVPPCVLISSGELIVTVGKEHGMGGRNQEYALSAAMELSGSAHVIMGSVDSDGTDGPGHQFAEGNVDVPVLTGGLVDGSTALRATELGIDLHEAVKHHNTSPALYQLGDGIVATPSMSMGDLSVTLILEQSKT